MSIGCGNVRAAVLKLQIALDKAAYRPGERIVVTATLTNVGDDAIFVRRSADETGRSDGFGFELRKDSGNGYQSALPLPYPQPAVNESLSPDGTHTRKIVLNSMLGSLKPGMYRLTIIYSAPYPHGAISMWSEPLPLEIVSQE